MRRLVALGATLSLTGCAALLHQAAEPVPSPTPSPVASPKPWPPPNPADLGYKGLAEPMPAPGARPLLGRVIVVDPGHGGSETGTAGPAGLVEKDVNLAVATQLAELLKGAGAEVVLTRTGDTGVGLAGAGLAADLLARASVANDRHADLFVSVHHNATLDPQNTRNGTETYYKMDDPGPSVDLGMALHRHLTRNLGLPQERFLPGNYAVLRNARVPAVLGEASYLSNAFTEQLLRQPEKQLLEAQAYFLGILDYLQRGTPRVTSLEATGGLEPRITARLDGGGTAIDPASIELAVDDEALTASFDAGALLYEPSAPWPNGHHRVRLMARNLGGNRTPMAEATFDVARSPATVTATCTLPAVPFEGPVPVSARVLDAHGLPVADGTPVRWTTSAGRLVAETPTMSGLATALLLDARPGAHLAVEAGAARGETRLPATRAALLTGQVEAPDGLPVKDARVLALGEDTSRMTTTDAQGVWWMTQPPAGLRTLRVAHPGYRGVETALAGPRFVRTALAPGLSDLATGSVVFLNPEGGANEPDLTRRRYSDLNWRVADHLRGYLQAAGAVVRLTRSRDENPSDIERVRRANAQGATLFLTLGHGGTGALSSAHYPTSAKGRAIAGALRTAALAYLADRADGGTAPDSSYTLIQTTCPSVTAVLGAPSPDSPERALRREAYALYQGLLAPASESAAILVKVTDGTGHPVPDVLVQLDERWIGQTNALGSWRFAHLDPGPHRLTITAGSRLQTTAVPDLKPGEERALGLELAPR